MANKIGRFEILSEITRSEIGAVYKAADPESGQTIALKAIQLQMLGDQASVLIDHILQEADGTKTLSSHNIAVLYGLEEIEGQFCAAMEYVQGNSIGTMLARKEGFSIWDLQDIARQTCQGLDHAHSHHVVHYSLEPAKIMVTWDGTVKILSFGVSSMGAFTCQASGRAPEVLHYVSPEQLSGDPVDARSNVFSLGAILYEMVTESKAFAGHDADEVRQAIYGAAPVAPIKINPKIHPALSEVIMKALSRAPEERYQSGQDLVNDLERCKESATKTAPKKSAQPASGLNAPTSAAKKSAAAAANQGGSTSSVASPASAAKEVAPPAPPVIARSGGNSSQAKAAAAAAGWDGGGSFAVDQPGAPKANESRPGAFGQSTLQERASAVAESEEAAVQAPPLNVDPAMVEGTKGGTRGPSFSEISELPPLKEIHTPLPPPPVEEPQAASEPVASWQSR